MDRDKAIELLSSGPDGVREWNEYRKSGKLIPHLNHADLSQANLLGANLNDAKGRPPREATVAHWGRLEFAHPSASKNAATTASF